MSVFESFPKAYQANEVEDQLNELWAKSGYYNPDLLPDRNQAGEPYCIVMPPPNRTGTLHMGHATMLAIQDTLMRFERMRGKKTLWVPGTDHAAIATQVKVEQLLMKEGFKDPRKELGREKFLERVVAFADDSANTIRTQVKKMGSSCDWSREAYTFDEERNAAVNKIFLSMYEDGLIERGFRIVNWDPQFQTTLSDDEVQTKDVKAKLVTFKYDKDFPITISSTRPETKFGDTAVAVHPTDNRYVQYVGKTLSATFCGKPIELKVIADEAVDPAFGTGALGVTPAHSMIDAEMAARHSLPTIQVIDQAGRMMQNCGEHFAELTTEEARIKVIADLEAAGLVEKIEEVDQALPIAERGGATVEQLPSLQWFVRVNKEFTLKRDTLKQKAGETTTLKRLMQDAVRGGSITIVPDRFEKVYFHWIDGLRDWCISRQIWFGHRIPVWYKGDEQIASVESPGEGYVQDEDSLDTWFSSGSWSFSALGWPNKEVWEKNKTFHPTNVLETGRDILFFSVARMVLMSTYAIGEVPFKDVYLHGLVMDDQGRKMSKSLGNILDPLELIPKYGTDAVRLSLMMGTAPGQDTRLSETKIESLKHLANKLWNISRFMLSQIHPPVPSFGKEGEPAESSLPKEGREDLSLADQWIKARFAETASSITKKLETYQFSLAAEELRDFTWNDLADWYLEIAKVEGNKSTLLKELLSGMLRLWHPFMPFVTEEIWQRAGFDGLLLVAEWPQNEVLVVPSEFETLRTVIGDMRRLRADQGVDVTKKAIFVYQTDDATAELINTNSAWVLRLTNSSQFDRVDTLPSDWPVVAGSVSVAMSLEGLVDIEKEKAKIQKELEQLASYITSTTAKLADQEFRGKAPEKVIAGMESKLEEAKQKQEMLSSRIAMMVK
ncbi:MAG: valine--tRNA ligase [Candidatus Magasanikbacteria bacterium]|nr:valine--tRNA ligase [Candidatus Magasanikbacteria bacterium]